MNFAAVSTICISKRQRRKPPAYTGGFFDKFSIMAGAAKAAGKIECPSSNAKA